MEPEEYERMRETEDSHWWYVGMRAIVDAVLDRALPRRELRILDAGCGTGGNLAHLSSRGQVIGLDVARPALSYCRQRGQTQLVRGSTQELPCADDRFDLVVSFDVLYHRGIQDDVAALREFHRVLHSKGMLLIRLPAFNWLASAHDLVVHTRQRYTAAEVSTKLQIAGFAVERITYVNFLLFPAAVMSRMLSRRGGAARSDLGSVSPIVNRSLTTALRLESRLVKRFDLPWGLSVLALARKGDMP